MNSAGLRSLSVAELRARPAHAGGGRRKTSARALAGMARRAGVDAKRIGGSSFVPIASIDLESAKEELDRLLRVAVREHLVTDVPLGVWTSGGLDSTTILHYAAQASSEQLKTFSVSFTGRSFDESEYFREVAQRLRHRSSRIRSESGRRHSRRGGAVRLLFRRAERRRRRGAGVVSFEDVPRGSDCCAIRGRRGRTVRWI